MGPDNRCAFSADGFKESGVDIRNGEIPIEDDDLLAGLLDEEIGDELLEHHLLLGSLQHLIHAEESAQKIAEVVFQDAHPLGPLVVVFQNHVGIVGEIDDDVEAGPLNEFVDVTGDVIVQGGGFEISGRTGFDVADGEHIDTEIGEGVERDQVQKKGTGTPATDNGQVEWNALVELCLHSDLRRLWDRASFSGRMKRLWWRRWLEQRRSRR